MRIAYITSQFPAPSETFACNDIRILKELGANPSVFTLRGKHKKYSQMIIERDIQDIPIHTCNPIQYIQGLLYGLLKINLMVKLIIWLVQNDLKKTNNLIKCLALIPSSFYLLYKLKKFNPDIVHLFWGHYPSLVGYLVNISMHKTKLTMFLGAYDLVMGLGISKSLALKANLIFTHSYANFPMVLAMGVPPSKIKLIYRGIDTQFLKKNVTPYFKEKDSIITAGRLISSKRTDRVISIVPHLPKSNSLLIAGDGPELNRLKDLAKKLGVNKQVQFLGFLSQQKLFQKLSKSQYFVMLSNKKGERLPNVIKEAMLASCVCIVSHTPGIHELIQNGKNGFILTDFDSKAIVRLINNLSSAEIDNIGKNAKRTIIESFDVRTSMQKYLKAWHNC